MERQGGHKKQLINLCFSEVQVDPLVYNMLHEDPGNVSYSAVGGLNEQIRELRESIELPLMNPELFIRVGIKPPKVEDFFIYHLCFVVFFCCQQGLRLNRIPNQLLVDHQQSFVI
jgi:hypothetical protein